MVRNTPKAMALGAKLRAARTAKKMSLRDLAKQIGIDYTTLGRVELGERSASPEQVAAILAVLGVNGSAAEATIDLARDTTGSSWIALTLPEQRTQLAALLEIEQIATRIIDVSPLLVPGLLQTGSYARAIMRAGDVPNVEVETLVAVRVGRRDILLRTNPVRLTAIIDQGVLRRMIGGPGVMVEQLAHLLRMSELPNVDLRVIPDDTDWQPALAGPFVVLTIDKTTSLIHLENRRSGLFLQEEEDLAAYQEAADGVLSVAMSSDQSSELIAREADRIKRIE